MTLVRPSKRKRDLRFGTWNVRSLHGADSLTAAARELAGYKLYLVGVKEVRWDKGGTVRVGDYSYCYWYYARSPFVSLLSRRSQSGRWSSFGKRVWFTESHIILIISFFFLLIVLFTQFILDIKHWSAISSKTSRPFLGNWHSHFSVLLPAPHSYATDFLIGLLASVISS